MSAARQHCTAARAVLETRRAAGPFHLAHPARGALLRPQPAAFTRVLATVVSEGDWNTLPVSDRSRRGAFSRRPAINRCVAARAGADFAATPHSVSSLVFDDILDPAAHDRRGLSRASGADQAACISADRGPRMPMPPSMVGTTPLLSSTRRITSAVARRIDPSSLSNREMVFGATCASFARSSTLIWRYARAALNCAGVNFVPHRQICACVIITRALLFVSTKCGWTPQMGTRANKVRFTLHFGPNRIKGNGLMTNSYIIALRASGSREHVFLHREWRRNQVAAKRFREAGIIAYADLYDGYAEQNRLEIEALAKVDQRIAALDATLRGEDNPFANAEFAPRHEDLPVKVRA